MAEFQQRALLQLLTDRDIRFVVIGAIAAIAQGYPLTTRDLDITPERSDENLQRLTNALIELRAELRLPDGSGLPFPLEEKVLAQSDSWTLSTALGELDILFQRSGTGGYVDLRRDALQVDLGEGLAVRVASLRDVIRSKEAAGRSKDLAQLPALRQTLEVIRERQARGRPV